MRHLCAFIFHGNNGKVDTIYEGQLNRKCCGDDAISYNNKHLSIIITT